MLKLSAFRVLRQAIYQPPSGGCVLKLIKSQRPIKEVDPAAFRRLCVETPNAEFIELDKLPSRLQAAVC